MPQLGVEPLTEKSMWGVTPFDQLMCRIDFKASDLSGYVYAAVREAYIEWPSLLGGMNWGGITIDERTGTLFVNDTDAAENRLLVRKEDMAKYKSLHRRGARALWGPCVRKLPGHTAACGLISCGRRWAFP